MLGERLGVPKRRRGRGTEKEFARRRGRGSLVPFAQAGLGTFRAFAREGFAQAGEAKMDREVTSAGRQQGPGGQRERRVGGGAQALLADFGMP